MEEELKKLTKAVKVNRVFGILTMCFTIVTMILVLVVSIRTMVFIHKAEPAMKVIAEVDVDAMNRALNNMNKFSDTFHVDELLDAIDKLPLDELGAFLENVDMDKWNKTLENLNSATDALQNMKKKMDPLFGFFGSSSGGDED